MAEPVWQFQLSVGNEPLFSVPVRTQGCQIFPNAHPWASHPIALGLMPDGHYTVKSFATDGERNNVCAYGVFSATHTGQGGPLPPTGKSTNTDYVYVMQFEGDKISHMTKIWNSGWALRELGWG